MEIHHDTFKKNIFADTKTNGLQITQATVIVPTDGLTGTLEESGIALSLNGIFKQACDALISYTIIYCLVHYAVSKYCYVFNAHVK